MATHKPAPAPDDEQLAHDVLDTIGWEQYIDRVDQGSPLYLMRAGRFDDSYSDRLAAMHWDELFELCPALFRCFAANLARHFRHVLVDSRTGRTDSAGICTTLLPSKLVVVFTPNRQSLEGVQALVTRATAYRRSHEDEQRPLVVYPLPSRIEMGDSTQRAQWRRGEALLGIIGYQPIFEQLLADCYGLQQISLDSYFDEVQLQQTRTFAYGEQLAVRIDQGGDRFSLTRTFEAMLDWLAGGYLPWQSSREIHLLAAIAEARHALAPTAAGAVAKPAGHSAAQAPGGARAVALPMARDLGRLGELYRREGRHAQALQCFDESLQLRRRALGDEHPDTLASKSRLAAILRRQGRFDDAQVLEQAVVDGRTLLLGPDHLDTLAARASLAATLAHKGQTDEALAIQERLRDAYRRLLGPDHLLTLDCEAVRADMLFQRGDLELARALQEQVVAARKRLLGAEHADTLRSKTALAQTLARMQQLEQARRLLDSVLQAHAQRLGADHPETRRARAGLAEVQSLLGEPVLMQALHQDGDMDAYRIGITPVPPGTASDLSAYGANRSNGSNGGGGVHPRRSRREESLLALDGAMPEPRPRLN